MTDPKDIEVWWKRLGCIGNPGTHTGEESARDAEIKELRQALAERVNHLELLKKYMHLVIATEKYDYLGGMNTRLLEKILTEEEQTELERISEESEGWK